MFEDEEFDRNYIKTFIIWLKSKNEEEKESILSQIQCEIYKNEEDHENEIIDTVSSKITKWLRVYKYDEEEIKFAKAIARNCLSKERMDDFHTWIEVGWCLHNIDSSLEMFDVWMEVSAKSDKFRYNNINALRTDWRKNWNGSSDTSLSLRTLRFWAKLDNPHRYKEINGFDNTFLNVGKNTFLTKVAEMIIAEKYNLLPEKEFSLNNINDDIEFNDEFYIILYVKNIHYNYIKNNSLSIYYSMNGTKTVWGPWNKKFYGPQINTIIFFIHAEKLKNYKFF
jgi:hypothetical protein